MKLDLHVHTFHSGHTTIYPLSLFMKESYNSPEGVYRRAKARGMDLVTITDHDEISGAMTIADRPDDCRLRDHGGLSKRRRERAPRRPRYLRAPASRDSTAPARRARAAALPETGRHLQPLNHVASRINGAITAPHIAALMPWVDGIEIINGSRLPSQNLTAACLADACGKVGVAGSDSHTRRGIGRTWVEAPHARTREAFLSELHAGRVVVGGGQGHYFTMASDMLRLATGFYLERGARLARAPFSWRQHAWMLGAALGLPLIAIPLASALAHFILEDRFNRALLFDLVKRPAIRLPEAA